MDVPLGNNKPSGTKAASVPYTISPYLNIDPTLLAQQEPEFILPEGANSRRGRHEQALPIIGSCICSGAGAGSVYGMYKGLTDANMKALEGRYTRSPWRTQFINVVTRHSTAAARTTGTIGMFYCGFGSLISYYSQQEKWFVSTSAGAVTGFVYKFFSGYKQCGIATLAGAVIAFGIHNLTSTKPVKSAIYQNGVMSSDIGDWYRGIPQMTRYWFTASVVLPMAGKIGVITPVQMIFNFYLFAYKFHIWRPITALFYYPITPQTGFHYLMNLYFLYSYSTQLETSLYQGRPAEYLFALIFMWLCSCIIAVVAEIALLMDIMVMAVLYLWCANNKDVIVRFWFGTMFKAMYLPWILFLFNLIIRGGGMDQLFGILVGHMYFFLMFKYPQDFGGRQLISCPQFLYNWFPSSTGGVHGFGQRPQNRAPSGGNDGGGGGGGGRHQWGGGNRLGGN